MLQNLFIPGPPLVMELFLGRNKSTT